MSKENVLCGLDIGSTKIRTIIVKKEYDSSQYLVVGVGESLSYGIRKGTMVDFEETVSSISESLEKAERMSGVQINHAVVSIGGTHISSQNSKGVIAVSRADGEVSSQDVERVIKAARAVSLPVNREILHIIPKNFIVDGQQGIKDPIGMNGMRLEVDAHIIEGGTHFIKNISRCTEQAGIEVDALVLSPLAAAKAILDKRQKELGVALVDIGGGTCGLAVFEEGDLIHSQILPVGAEHITNDLAIGLRTSIDTAERIKLDFGFANAAEVSEREEVNLSKVDSEEEGVVRKKEIAQIIEARAREIFVMVNKELKKIGKSGKLPAGVVFSGGGAKMPGLVDVAKRELKLPSQIGFPAGFKGMVDKIDDPAFATCCGLVIWGDEEVGTGESKGKSINFDSFKNVFGKVRNWSQRFLP